MLKYDVPLVEKWKKELATGHLSFEAIKERWGASRWAVVKAIARLDKSTKRE